MSNNDEARAHTWVPHEREGWTVCSNCGMVRNYSRETSCKGRAPEVLPREACNNDEAREAVVEQLFPAAEWSEYARGQCRLGWDACMAHLRATGQLCTAEERAVLDGTADWSDDEIRGAIEQIKKARAYAPKSLIVLEAELARRAKGEPDGG